MRKANLIAVFIAFVLALTGAAPSVLAASKSSPKTSPTKVMSGVVNINTATVDQIAKLPGIGPSLAAKIVQRRMSKPFSSPGELMEVKGIGKRKFQSMSQYVSVSGKTTFSVQKAKSPETAKQYKGGKSAKRASSTAEKPLSMNVAPGVLLAHRA